MTEAEKQHNLSILNGSLQRGEALYKQMRKTNTSIEKTLADFSKEPIIAAQMATFQQMENSIAKGEKQLESIRKMIAYVERTDASALTQENIMDAGL